CQVSFFFFQAEDGIRDDLVTGVQTCALPISRAATERDTRALAARPHHADVRPVGLLRRRDALRVLPDTREGARPLDPAHRRRSRSEERRVGKECRCRWWPR